MTIIKTIERGLNFSLETAAFAGMGYLSGRMVHEYVKWTSPSSIFMTSAKIDSNSAAACCALFTVIDRLAHSILTAVLGSKRTNQAIYSVIRIGASAVGAATALNAFVSSNALSAMGSNVRLTQMEIKPAVAVIVLAIVIYNHVMFNLSFFNQHWHNVKPVANS
jgi:hypothetical protein